MVVNNLEEKVERLKEEGWIEVPRKGFGEVGMLIESKLGLDTNSFPVADCDGVEIKVQGQNSKYPLTLFSLTCDGPDFYEMRRLINRFGIKHDTYPDIKVMFLRIKANEYTSWGRYLKFKLYIDWKLERIYIIVAHSNGKIIEKRAFWEFDSLRACIERKILNMCYITVIPIFFNSKKYVKCSDVQFYKCRGFKQFLSLIDQGKIFVNIKTGVYKTGKKAGKPYDHGVGFQISKCDFLELFEKIK